jgi:hypothetical protein
MYHKYLRRGPASVALAAVLVLAAGAVAAQDQNGKEARLVGAWSHVVHFRDCATGADLRTPFPALNTFHKDHSSIEQSAGIGPGTRTLSQGLWRRSGARSFVNRAEFFVFDSAGTPLLRIVNQRTLEISADGQSLTANGTAERYAMDGTFVARICVVETGTRMAEPDQP